MLVDGADRKSLERSLAAHLIEAGKLEEPVLDRVLRLQRGNEERLEALLVKLGFAGERDVAEALAEQLGLTIAAAADYPDAPLLEGQINHQFLTELGVLPLAETEAGLKLAMVDPLDRYAQRAVEMASGLSVLPVLALPSELEAAYARLYSEAAPQSDPLVGKSEDGADDAYLEDVDRLRDLASEGPVIRLVGQLITK